MEINQPLIWEYFGRHSLCCEYACYMEAIQRSLRYLKSIQRGEVREDADPRAGWRVGEKSGAGTKEQRRSEEVMGE